MQQKPSYKQQHSVAMYLLHEFCLPHLELTLTQAYMHLKLCKSREHPLELVRVSRNYLPLVCKLRPVKAVHRENICNFNNNYLINFLYLKECNELQLISFSGN